MWDAALHEAAHALAFAQGGLPVYSIRVHEPGDPRCGGSVLIDDLDVETDAEHRAMLLGALTGGCATAKFCIEDLGWEGEEAWEHANQCSQTDQQSFAKAAGAWPDSGDSEVAEEWVDANWDDIWSLAEELVARGGVVTAGSVL